MSSINEIVGHLKFSRSALLDSIKGLSSRELAETPIYNDDWTVKDIFAHLIGWDQRVIKILPLIVAGRANEVAGVNVDAQNRQAVAACKAMPSAKVLSKAQATYQQVLDILSLLDHKEIDRRHERNDRTITIRSYVVDIMAEHQRQHALEIAQWRKTQEQRINPAAIKLMLAQNKSDFMQLLTEFDEIDLLNRTAVGDWSVSDVVGHIVDWEQRILNAAKFIHNPSLPPLPPAGGAIQDWNKIMAARRMKKSWDENYQDLLRVQLEMGRFVETLKPGDWRLRGSYPWPDDQGTLAELVTHAAEHYHKHLLDVRAWQQEISG